MSPIKVTFLLLLKHTLLYIYYPSKDYHRDTMITHSWRLYAVVVSWLSLYIKFPKAERYISGLEFTHDLAGKNFVDILIDYLKEYFEIKLPAAAIIVNVQAGFSSILLIFTAHISDAHLGLFKTIVFVNVFYLIGLVLFCISVYLESIDKKILLYVALFFLALGLSGRDFLLELFLSVQRLSSSDSTIAEDEVNRAVSWRPYVKLLLSTVVLLVLGTFLSGEGEVILIITTAMVFTGLLCFLLGHSFYRKRPQTGGPPLATVIHVFRAAILKRHLEYPIKPSQFHENESASSVLLPSIPFFRWLDRAATLESSSICKEEPETSNRLCTVAEVKEVKRLLTMIPMWALFIVYSVVGAAGNTFFFEQASSMDDGFLPIIFVICQALASRIASDVGKIIITKLQFFKIRQRLATVVQIGTGMLCSLCCCIVAWRVERFRLNTGNMSVFWLTPQFLLLGCMEGFAEKGVSEFFKTQVSGSMRDYGPAFSEFILGIGKFISAILVVIFKDWFGGDADSSTYHLDRYYEFLAWLSLLNFFLFVLAAVWYGNQQMEMENLIPISKILPHKSHSFPPQGSRVPKLQRFFTAIGYEKEA